MGKARYVLTFTLIASIPVLAQRPGISLPGIAIPGHLQPRARAGADLGRMDPSTQLKHMMVVLKPSAAQQTDLDRLLAAQQDPASPSYHQWLTPEQFADRFGLPQAEIDRLGAWLTAQGLTIESVARGRTAVSFSGPSGAVETAFNTELHKFDVNGEIHFANTSDPTVPASLASLVASVHGLHDFRMRPSSKPRYTSTSSGNHYIAPDDLATVYNIRPLYGAGIDGTGQKIAIVGQTQLPLADIRQFRTYFNLPAKDPSVTLVPNTQDPGLSTDDLGEADLDVEWAGAVARNADIQYIYSYDVTDALYYAIDQNLAPVVSMSYGLCETDTGQADLNTLRTYAQRANAQGITWLTASGDSGANDCYASSARTVGQLGVDAPASIPEVTGVGGTTLNEGTGTYWSTNDSNHASVLTWIPEVAWNDSVADGSPSSSGGGASGFFTKPAWQTGTGVPADGWRDVPDISLAASADHDGYIVYTAGALEVYGGTSAGAPTFAGSIALLNHYLTANALQSAPGVGNINARLYSLSQTVPTAFHDIVSGDNIVSTCPSKGRGVCTSPSVGYSASVGYDQATGLGSVDVYTLISNWKTGFKARALVSLSVRTASLADGSMSFTPAFFASDGGAVTGSVTYTIGSGAPQTAGVASVFTASAAQLSGANSVTAVYNGNYPSISTTISLLGLTSINNAGSYKQTYAPGMLAAIFGTRLAGSTQAASSLPLPTTLDTTSVTINGTPAPLWFVSPGQINLQIPSTVSAGSTAILKITNNGESVTSQFPITATAPGIFLDTNGALPGYASAARGQTIAMYMTGDGTSTAYRVSAGGADSPIVYSGKPAWGVGVTQINFTIPATAPLGPQPVTVTVGNATSAPATLNVTQ